MLVIVGAVVVIASVLVFTSIERPDQSVEDLVLSATGKGHAVLVHTRLADTGDNSAQLAALQF